MIRQTLPCEEATRHPAGVLDTASAHSFDDLVKLAAHACAAPMAVVAFLHGGRASIWAKTGFAGEEMPGECCLCEATARHAEVLSVEDTEGDTRFAGHPFVRGPPFVRSWAGAAVTTSDGQPCGALCVLDRVPRAWDTAQRSSLEALARQVAVRIELQQANQAVSDARAERGQLAGLLRAATEYSIIATHLDGTIRVFNEGAERMLGYRAEELIGRVTPLFIHDPAEVAARARVLGISPGFGVFVHAACRGEAETREWTYVRKDGGRVPVSLTVTAIRENGRDINGFIGIARDVTTERRAEGERARLLVERAARTAAERALDRLNRLHGAAVALSAAVTPEEVARVVLDHGMIAFGATAGVVVHLREDRQTLDVVVASGQCPAAGGPLHSLPVTAPIPVAEAVRTCSPVFVEEIEACAGRGGGEMGYPWVCGERAVAAAPLLLEDDRQRRSVGGLCLSFAEPRAFRDEDRVFLLALGRECAQALERARLYQAEATARAHAERSEQAKDEFLAILSHELRTPLAAVLGWTKMVQAQPEDANRVKRGLMIIERNAVALHKLIEDILDVSRIVAGKLDIDRSPVDIAAELRRAIEHATPTVTIAGIALDASIDPAAGAVMGDAPRLQQVIANLLSNAVKFTPGGGRIDVRLERAGAHVRLQIADTGVGIAPGFLPQAFDRFRQAESSRTRAHGGLGLGLSIAKHIIEAHGGTISVESEGVGRGATVTVLLPVADPAALSARATTAPER